MDTYIFNICVPVDRKAGKYLQKIAGKNHNVEIKALVESLNFSVDIVDKYEDCVEALCECQSCQSRDRNSMAVYWKVWSSLPDCHIVILRDEDDIPVARGVVNPSLGTYTNMYGPNHYCLEARCKFAGLEYGEVTNKQKVEDLLRVRHTAKTEIPKSRTYWKYGITYEEEIDRLARKQELIENTIDSLRNQDIAAYMAAGGSRFDYNTFKYKKFMESNWDLIKRSLDLKEKINLLRWHAPEDIFKKIKPTLVHVPISEDWTYREEEHTCTVESSFYLDSASCFVAEEFVYEKGWIRK